MENENPHEEKVRVTDGNQKGGRSASYPVLTLMEAFHFTKKVYEKFSNTQVTRKEIAAALNRHHSGIARDIAACAAFGFLDKSLSKGELEAKYNTTSLFSDLLRPENEKQKKIAQITAFGKPKLYQELIDKFDGEVIPETLVNTLIKHFSITQGASQECADVFINSGQEAGVINDNKLLNYKVTLSVVMKANFAEAEIEEESSGSSYIQLHQNAVVKADPLVPVVPDGKKIPIHLTKEKMAYLVYPTDITPKDIKLLEHAISGILLRLDLEKDEANPDD